MRREKGHKMGLWGAILGFLVAVLMNFAVVGVAPQVNAEEATETEPVLVAVEPADREKEEKEEEKEKELATADNCQDSLGSIGWLVCPTTGKIAEAVDFLYGVLEDFLKVNPVVAEDGQPVYEIWKYCRGVTNIIFIIFFLVVIYSQLTGVGISNYGIKKALPKLIVVAILMNLSFLLCSLAVDASNILGNGLRGVFTSVQETAMAGMEVTYSSEDLFNALALGSTVTIGGTTIAFATGAIWMVIPVLLGALVSVVAGLVVIAMRQAVIILLIMVAPLAIVAYMLPNTEDLFKKWKKLMTKMLVFYPAFSVLFGASQLAGFAIITSANNWFMLLLGVAVQIFPLFLAVKMMQMSGTFLGTVSSKIRGMASKPLATNRAWADSHRELARRKNAALENPKLPSRRLVGFLADRKTQREVAAGKMGELQKKRAMANLARRNYRNGIPTRKGEKEYEAISRSLEYDREIARNENNMNAGLGTLAAMNTNKVKKAQKARVEALDNRIVNASDYLNVEKARGEKIQYENAVGFHNRMNAAIEAHMDIEHGYTIDPDTGMRVRDKKHKMHMKPDSAEAVAAATRYAKMSEIMEGNAADVQYAAATAARGFDAQKKIVENTYQKYFDLTPPTKDVVYRLTELTKQPDAAEYMDAIIPGLRVLSQRGDTDLVRKQMNNVLNSSKGLELGTNASQSLASFLMLEVKDKDPWLRRFGKYINLETARAYGSGDSDRQEMKITYDEYIKGYHDEPDPTPEEPLRVRRVYAKKGMKELMQGTPVDNVERTALSNFDESLREAYTGPDGLDIDEYLRKRDQVQNSIGPQFASASLKYLSGSEQINSFVKFLTGYSQGQAKQNGQMMVDANGEPIYAWSAAWEKGGEFSENPEHAKKAKEYFRNKTISYITAQTPTQIYSLRSDYKVPLFEHLADAYELDDMEGWSEEEKANHRKYMDELAEIETRYGDLPLEEANEKRMADKKALRNRMENEIAGPEFRHLLDKVGTLNMLYRTRDKGAANGAKPWVRDWLDLENEQMIRAKLKRDGQKGKKKKKGNSDDVDAGGNVIYGDAERTRFMARVDDIYNNLGTDREDKFYDESFKYIKGELGGGSYIVKEYEKYAKRETAADSEMLKDYIINLLKDEDNY